jgi:small subunit ribosomal protein S8
MSVDLRAHAFTIIRNGGKAGKEKVDIKRSRFLLEVTRILKREGFIQDVREIEDKKQGLIRIYLKYNNRRCAIRQIQQISKPGLRVYARRDRIPKVLSGHGMAILSTSQGLLTDREARKLNIGGEVICHVW